MLITSQVGSWSHPRRSIRRNTAPAAGACGIRSSSRPAARPTRIIQPQTTGHHQATSGGPNRSPHSFFWYFKQCGWIATSANPTWHQWAAGLRLQLCSPGVFVKHPATSYRSIQPRRADPRWSGNHALSTLKESKGDSTSHVQPFSSDVHQAEMFAAAQGAMRHVGVCQLYQMIVFHACPKISAVRHTLDVATIRRMI